MHAASLRADYAELFPHAPLTPPLTSTLPLCAKKLRVFVYTNLTFTDGRFDGGASTAEVLRVLELQRARANCDWARSPCLETSHSGTGGNWDYSNQRQYTAEVPLLAKFISMAATRRRAWPAAEADLFVVPWLGSSELTWWKRQWSPSSPTINARFRSVLRQLKYYEGRERRHVFLSSRDLVFVALEAKREALRRGAMLLHYGPRRPSSRDIVVAPNSAGFGAPLEPLVHPAPLFVFSMMDPKLNRQRANFSAAVQILNSTRDDVRYYPIGDHRRISLPPLEALAMMQRSLLCPIAQGDLPYQHRLFDALASGCVPLFLTYNTSIDGRECESWSYDPLELRNGVPQQRRGAACIEQTLPYHRTVPWRKISVRVDARLLPDPERLAGAIAALDRAELAAKRRLLERVRHRFVYDWTGESADAFASTLEEICAALPA